MSLIKKIFHTTKSGISLPLIDLSDEEFEDFLSENGFEVVVSEGVWTQEAKENILATMVKTLNSIYQESINQISQKEKEDNKD